MQVPATNPQDSRAAVAAILIVVVSWSVFYWRTALRVLLVMAVGLIFYTAFTGLSSATSLLTTLHHL
jgi:hypothetical protein